MKFQDLKRQSKVHFIGLGGIGMSALAFILRHFNIKVQGSDLNQNYLTEKLRAQNIDYFLGHDAKNIDDDVSLVVKTSIIKDDNCELIAAKNKNITIITRADLLAIIMEQYKGVTIAGTHGKTSTTAIVALMFEIAGLDPTVVNGGVINYFSSNSKVGQGNYLVAESDESDASFVKLPSFIGAVTNLEPEHLDFAGYDGSFDKQKAYFEQYITQISDNGICALSIDSPELAKIYDKLKSQKSNLVTYSIKQDADLTAKNITQDVSGVKFDVIFKNGRQINDIKMPIYGEHNVSNSLIAIAIADFLNLSDEIIKKALLSCNGVKRRFTKVGQFRDAAIIDDYGHHPTEIEATLKVARNLAQDNKVISVFQPHKYSRLRDLFSEFCNAFENSDIVIIADIYAAGQKPIAGASQDDLILGIKNSGHKNVIKLNDDKDLAAIIEPLVKPGDLIFFSGAGNITSWAANLEQQLNKLVND